MTVAPPSTHNFAPYEDWMLGAGKSYDFAERFTRSGSGTFHLSSIIETPDSPFTATSCDAMSGTDCLLPTLWRGGDGISFLPVLLKEAIEGADAQDDLRKHIGEVYSNLQSDHPDVLTKETRFRTGYPVSAPTIDPNFAHGGGDSNPIPSPDVIPNAPLVITACIDDGIPFAHQNFFSDTHSRLEYCWTQSAPTDGSCAVLFGREFNRQQIEALVSHHAGDEDALYRAANVMGGHGSPTSPLARASSHGAHVMDLLGGEVQRNGNPQTRLIAVDLPTAATWDTSGFGMDMYVLSALHYIFDRAERIAKTYGTASPPLVINLSYGTSGGPHNGSGQLEAAIDELIAERRKTAPTVLVMPSGNMFLDRLHATLGDPHFEEGLATLDWRVQPNDRTSSFVEMWLPEGSDIRDFSVSLTAPHGKGETILLGDGLTDKTFDEVPIAIDGESIGQLSFDLHRGRNWRILIALAPTATSNDNLPAAPSGSWRIALKRPIKASGTIECWIQRDIDYGTMRTGARQSYFDDPMNPVFTPKGALSEVDRYEAKARRHGSMNGMATGLHTLTVGGSLPHSFRSSDIGSPSTDFNGKAARFASAGPSGLTSIGNQVDCAAAVDFSPIQTGIRAAGTRSGTLAQLRGTSMASPQVARALAEAMLALTPEQIATTEASNYLDLLHNAPRFTNLPATASESDRLCLGTGVLLHPDQPDPMPIG